MHVVHSTPLKLRTCWLARITPCRLGRKGVEGGYRQHWLRHSRYGPSQRQRREAGCRHVTTLLGS